MRVSFQDPVNFLSLFLLTFCFATSAMAFSVPSKTMTFEIHSRKTDVIARVRQYARQNQYFFKLPIEFKKSVLFREPNIQGHLNLQTCFSADPKSSVVWIEVKATDAGNLFTSSVQKFDNAQYLVTALEKIFPGEKLEPKSTTRGNKTCQELERIQWPNNIF